MFCNSLRNSTILPDDVMHAKLHQAATPMPAGPSARDAPIQEQNGGSRPAARFMKTRYGYRHAENFAQAAKSRNHEI